MGKNPNTMNKTRLILFFLFTYTKIGGGFRLGKYNMFMDSCIQLLRVLKVKFNVDALIMSVEHR